MQCIVFTVGQGGFDTESGYDFVMFEESNNGSGMFITDKFIAIQIKE